jgi:malate dehydrogenase (oxaloacetate-decarboxylating)(NADP+)
VTRGKLVNQKLLFLGAGEAATGIADLVVAAMVAQGCPEDEARRSNWLVDSRGLVVSGRANLAEHKVAYAHQHPPIWGSYISDLTCASTSRGISPAVRPSL